MSAHTILSTRATLVILLAAATICAPSSREVTASPGEDILSVRKGDTSIVVVDGTRKVFTYRRGDVRFKPYVKTLTTPKGINVLLDSPADHQHHHGLMFAIGADGVDFWSETHTDVPGAQRELRVKLLSDARHGRPEVGLYQALEWVSLGEKKEVLLTEERTVSVCVTEESPVTLVTWTSRLELPAGKVTAELWGRHYFGLGLRFVRSMDATGRFRNSSSREGTVVRGDERLVPAKWCAYTAEVDGRPVTVAMFDAPENPRHPATWFTMTKPFAYMSATLNLQAEPLTLRGAAPLSLRYGVALWDGRTGTAEIEAVYREWAGR